MYLYYFDSDQSESPRGIIDLEYFTDCSADEEGVLTLQPTAGIPLRSFFFQIDDPTVRSDWLGTLMSERYQTIREERDAYKQMQTHFSSEMNSVTAIMHTSSQDNVKMQADLDAALLNVEEAFQMIKRLLAVVEVGDDDLIDPAACDAIGPASEALERRLNDMRAKLEIEKLKEIEVIIYDHCR
jgi:esterase/lipase